MAEREIMGWITLKDGRRIPYFGLSYDRTPDYDLRDALSESKNNSVKDNLKDGKLSKERNALYNKIIEDYFKGHNRYKPGEEKYCLFTGGGPASGKGGFVKNIDKYYSKDDNPVKIDPDEIKKLLLKADTGKDTLDPETTGYYHEESSMLAKRIFEVGIKNNYPVLFDGTATGIKSLIQKLDLASGNGYRTQMCFMTAPAGTVLDSSLSRYANTGRIVDINVMLSAHTKAQAAVPQILKLVDDVKVYSREGGNVVLMASGGKGKPISISDKRSWDIFMKEGAYDLDSGALIRYNQRVAQITANFEKKNKK